jgi:hypothetical protein
MSTLSLVRNSFQYDVPDWKHAFRLHTAPLGHLFEVEPTNRTLYVHEGLLFKTTQARKDPLLWWCPIEKLHSTVEVLLMCFLV